jgi:hypothetical protein
MLLSLSIVLWCLYVVSESIRTPGEVDALKASGKIYKKQKKTKQLTRVKLATGASIIL